MLLMSVLSIESCCSSQLIIKRFEPTGIPKTVAPNLRAAADARTSSSDP